MPGSITQEISDSWGPRIEELYDAYMREQSFREIRINMEEGKTLRRFLY